MSISIHKQVQQNYRIECQPRIEMGKMEANGPGILALLTAPPLSFFEGGGGRLKRPKQPNIGNDTSQLSKEL